MEKVAKKTFDEILSQLEELPSLPSMVSTTLNILDNPDSLTQDLTEALSYDQTLASRVLKMANSAYYGFPRKIDSLSKAVTILGYNSIRNIVLVTKIFDSLGRGSKDETLDRKGFWQHSLGCGAAAQVIGDKLGFGNGEEIFLAGLLHDIGKVILDTFLHDKYSEVLRAAQEKNLLLLEAERNALGATHEHFGYWLAEHWNLPLNLTAAIAFHHDPQKSEEYFIVTSLVHIGDILTRALEVGNGGDNQIPPVDTQAWAALNLKPALIENIIGDFENKLKQVQSFLPVDLA
ncbi:MAG: HDOD domain-containing protein [Deltaproteobacteria bacterium]|nr:HDOD domain-containing protein [Deltaproteobacteria bacterium]MBW2141667.1 HDOD domain-containing protein [Deltaproteobacteria bacterium]MBW2323185.1 HDOD domain-containing protein [Deltaproteobacteria bacterium]